MSNNKFVSLIKKNILQRYKHTVSIAYDVHIQYVVNSWKHLITANI